jgi:hypothetical protein
VKLVKLLPCWRERGEDGVEGSLVGTHHDICFGDLGWAVVDGMRMGSVFGGLCLLGNTVCLEYFLSLRLNGPLRARGSELLTP